MKTLVTECDSLDIRRLDRGGFLYCGTRCDWVWRNKDGSIKGAIAVAVLKGRLLLSYRQADSVVSERVLLTYSTGFGGGQRPWFQCPACLRRVAILYKNGGAFRCRRCAELVYPSQYPSHDRSYGKRCVAWEVQKEQTTPESDSAGQASERGMSAGGSQYWRFGLPN